MRGVLFFLKWFRVADVSNVRCAADSPMRIAPCGRILLVVKFPWQSMVESMGVHFPIGRGLKSPCCRICREKGFFALFSILSIEPAACMNGARLIANCTR